jgi:endonuclease/exonuclease/phosphatase family metal-dependent hydrolase
LNAKTEARGLGRTTLSVGGGFMLFLILVFGFYVAQDIALPFSRQVFPAAAASFLGLFIFVASAQLRRSPITPVRDSTGLYVSEALLLLPVIYALVVGAGPSPVPPEAGPVKVMTYNIHSGFNTAGLQDLEAIAEVIEESGADIVAMQETSRVRLMDGGADIPRWLSLRLGMPFVFHGTEEPYWGNTILSRYPIIESGWGNLPRAGKLIGRGYLWAHIDIDGQEPLLVIVTHLHHLGPDSEARQEQVPVLLESWNGQDRSIILGDLNAEPGSPEMRMFADAGLLDAWTVAGEGLGYTFPSDEPVKRIDWIWHSPDLQPLEIEVIQTQASDHRPLMASFTIGP